MPRFDRAANLQGRRAESGNDLALKHGSYSLLRLAPREQEIERRLWEIVPIATDGDGPAISLLAGTLAQAERALTVLALVQAEESEAISNGKRPSRALQGTLKRLEQDARGWINTATRLMTALGLTPTARAALGVDVARIEETRAGLVERYGGTPR